MTAELFTTSQKQALAALGVRAWQVRQPDPSPNGDVAPAATHTYRVADWLLVMPSPIPVQRPQWLLDLFTVLGVDGTTLTQVAPTFQEQWDVTRVLDLSAAAMNAPDLLLKRQLWQHLQRVLSADAIQHS